MGAPFYAIDGSTVRSDFFGFALELPPGWRVSFARAAGKTAMLHFSPEGGHSDQMQLNLFARDDATLARYVDDPAAARDRYPRTATYPFGEVRVATAFRRTLLFTKNDVIVQIVEKEGPPATEAGVESILHSLRFFAPEAETVPAQLRTFRYLHPRAGKRPPASDPALARLELEARLEHSRARGHLFVAGVLEVVLGRAEDARRSFLDAVTQAERRIADEPEDVQARVSALEAALFAGAEDRIAAHARAPGSPDERRFGADRALYLLSLGPLITGDDDACLDMVRRARPVKEKWAEGTTALIAAVAERDEGAFGEALNVLLDGHHRKARRRGSQIWNSPLSWVCVHATSLAIAAVRRGMTIPENLPARRATLKGLLVVAAQRMPDGAPVLPATTFDLDVDYIPDLLVG